MKKIIGCFLFLLAGYIAGYEDGARLSLLFALVACAFSSFGCFLLFYSKAPTNLDTV